jgi:hypothetical protein
MENDSFTSGTRTEDEMETEEVKEAPEGLA